MRYRCGREQTEPCTSHVDIHFDCAEQTISRTTSRSFENTAFRCQHCGAAVRALTSGSFRNHCPDCLWSLHVDVLPGDRAASCGGPMPPVGVDSRRGKGWVLLHRCQRCGHRSVNRVALDDPAQPDSAAAIGALMAAGHPPG